jgi:DNA modification methylase
MLSKIIKYQGQRAPIVVSNRSGFITKGHGRLMALQKLGFDKVAVDYQDYSDEAQEYADMIADNKIAELAEHDDKFMTDIILAEFPDIDLELLGLDDFKLEMPFEGKTDEDAVPDNAPARVQLGDVYQLGEHRLMCGDSTDKQCVEYLMNGEKADMVFTDPPYNVDYGGHGNEAWSQKHKKIENDNMTAEKFNEFTSKVFDNLKDVTDHCLYVCGHPGPDGRIMFSNLDKRYHCSTTIVWNKDRLVLGRGKYHNKYEPIWFGWVKDGSKFIDDRKLVNVWDFPRPQSSDLHPTMKPIGLVEIAINHASKKSVADLFGGSGSTLIACEKTNRKCFMMELDPHYCDVIIKRWEDFTGQQAKLVSSPGEKQPNRDTITKAEICL